MELNKTVESLLDSWDKASFELALALLGCSSKMSMPELITLQRWTEEENKPYGFGSAILVRNKGEETVLTIQKTETEKVWSGKWIGHGLKHLEKRYDE